MTAQSGGTAPLPLTPAEDQVEARSADTGIKVTWDAGSRSGKARHMTDEVYQHVQKRIHTELHHQAPSICYGIAFTAFGVGGSALLALLVFPKKVKGNLTNLPAGAQTSLVILACCAAVVFLLALGTGIAFRRRDKRAAHDICLEMDINSGLGFPPPREGGWWLKLRVWMSTKILRVQPAEP
jgi:hypothetical protein